MTKKANNKRIRSIYRQEIPLYFNFCISFILQYNGILSIFVKKIKDPSNTISLFNLQVPLGPKESFYVQISWKFNILNL